MSRWACVGDISIDIRLVFEGLETVLADVDACLAAVPGPFLPAGEKGRNQRRLVPSSNPGPKVHRPGTCSDAAATCQISSDMTAGEDARDGCAAFRGMSKRTSWPEVDEGRPFAIRPTQSLGDGPPRPPLILGAIAIRASCYLKPYICPSSLRRRCRTHRSILSA